MIDLRRGHVGAMPPGARKQDDASVTESPSEATAPGPGSQTLPQQLQTQTQMQAVTIPAPGPAGRDRPTTIPDYDVQAIAAASTLGGSAWLEGGGAPRGSPAPNALPLDLAIPIRKQRASVCGAPLRAAFLLSHVDDRMTIAEIAISAQLPLPDAIENFVLLADLGVVELRGSSQAPQAPAEEGTIQRPPTPKSGLRPKT